MDIKALKASLREQGLLSVPPVKVHKDRRKLEQCRRRTAREILRGE